MANTKFAPAEAWMKNSVYCESNGIWEIELYRRGTGLFEVRFAREFWSSFGSVWEDGLFHFSVDGAGIPPKYVLARALALWTDNVS